MTDASREAISTEAAPAAVGVDGPPKSVAGDLEAIAAR